MNLKDIFACIGVVPVSAVLTVVAIVLVIVDDDNDDILDKACDNT